jgi:hypothetical protein
MLRDVFYYISDRHHPRLDHHVAAVQLLVAQRRRHSNSQRKISHGNL